MRLSIFYAGENFAVRRERPFFACGDFFEFVAVFAQFSHIGENYVLVEHGALVLVCKLFGFRKVERKRFGCGTGCVAQRRKLYGKFFLFVRAKLGA